MDRKVFAIGLPRCGGQTLQVGLSHLLGHCVHSPGSDWATLDRYSVFAEVYVHPATLLKRYGNAKCLFILNERDMGGWLRSCNDVYHKRQGWNHPIWHYPIEGFAAFRQRYTASRLQYVDRNCRVNIVKRPRWAELCAALGVDVPTFEFPKIDRVKRKFGSFQAV